MFGRARYQIRLLSLSAVLTTRKERDYSKHANHRQSNQTTAQTTTLGDAPLALQWQAKVCCATAITCLSVESKYYAKYMHFLERRKTGIFQTPPREKGLQRNCSCCSRQVEVLNEANARRGSHAQTLPLQKSRKAIRENPSQKKGGSPQHPTHYTRLCQKPRYVKFFLWECDCWQSTLQQQ